LALFNDRVQAKPAAVCAHSLEANHGATGGPGDLGLEPGIALVLRGTVSVN
jgi:hypothetical protein